MSAIVQREIPQVDPAANAIDFSRPFIPEPFTPLFHTPAYGRLTAEQRLRYNQLHAGYFHEQIMFFEKALARNVLGRFLSEPLPEKLKSGVQMFMAEEARHSEMFWRLNKKCAPQFYGSRDFYFIRVPPLLAKILDAISRRPKLFPLFLWLMLLEEERALYYGKIFTKSPELEPHFMAVQRAHLADEIGHVKWDEELLDWIWPETNPLLRRINARLLCWMIDEFFSAPKRAGVRVVEELAKEFPSLSPELPRMRSELLALATNKKYRSSLYSPEMVPQTFARFEQWPEFAPVLRLLTQTE